MKILTADDVKAAGKRLLLRPDQRLTPLARDLVKERGIEVLMADSARAQPEQAPPPTRPSPDAGPAFTAPVVPPAAPFVLPVSGALYRRHALGPGESFPRHRPLAGVVGAGHVGALATLRLAQSDLFDQIALVDTIPGRATGLALDMWHGAGLYGFSTRLSGSEDLAALEGCDYIIITAGKPRQPGMQRTDLTISNAQVMQSVCTGIARYAPEATLVVVSNPLEEMTHLAARYSGFPQQRVLGMAGVLDSARFCALAAQTGIARPQDIRALALGSHGPEMVIPLSQAFIGHTPIESVLDAATLTRIVERTRDAGAEVVSLLKTGSAWCAPAESAALMVRMMAGGSPEIITACVRSGGAYGLDDGRVGLPVRLDRRGVKEIVQLPLREDELRALHEAAARIARRIAGLDHLPPPSPGTRPCAP